MTTTSSLFKNLITKSMNTKQLSRITCAIMLLFSMIACKKEGPITIDNIKPNLTFEISGIRTFNSDTDYTSLGNLYLEPGKKISRPRRHTKKHEGKSIDRIYRIQQDEESKEVE